MNRVGIGYDVHPLVEGRKLFLGGVELAHSKGLEGHSDADVLIHALADAILGALGAGERITKKARMAAARAAARMRVCLLMGWKGRVKMNEKAISQKKASADLAVRTGG